MRQPYHHRSLAYSGRHAIHRAGTKIACGKYAGNASLQNERIALLLPDARVSIRCHQVAAREHKSFCVAQHIGSEPAAPGARADEDKQRVRILSAHRSIGERLERDLLNMALALDSLDFSAGPKANVRRLLDLFDQVL